MTTGRGPAPYRRTRSFSQDDLPSALLGEHTTRAGVRAEVVVESGGVHLVFPGPPERRVHVRPGAPGRIPPEEVHHLELDGPVQLHVAFFHAPAP
jgi:tellurite resistance-related uncharacterized protein